MKPIALTLIPSLFALIALFSADIQSAERLDKIHFLIPAGPGGGWDGTARGMGEAMRKSETVSQVSFENLTGG
ncbi:MAG: hypothetical protein P8N51_11640, partial [Pseudomonadales bacterium]|nr:hypothetical protein [Pseudomonadales bacterium]